MKLLCKCVGITAVMLMVVAGNAWANNLAVTNVTVVGRDNNTALVKFDISWENSWRYTNINHDAAWVFFKVLPETRTAWEPVTLEGTGVNPPDYSTGTGTAIELIVPSDRMGCFVRRSGEGSGTMSVQNVKAVWNFSSNSLAKTDKVRIQAMAVEMVYVAEGSFAAGSGGNNGSEFTLTTINTNNASVVPSGTGSLGGQAGGYPTGQTAPTNVWPNGFGAFYCMKYEITQGQYCDFLNTLTRSQQTNRTTLLTNDYFAMSATNIVQYRNAIRCPSIIPAAPEAIVFGCDANTNKLFNETNDAVDRACNYLSWADGCAFTDWAACRPMTELEFEKACRGPLNAVSNEYAWGASAAPVTTGNETGDGSSASTAIPANANCNILGTAGPIRVGLFASSTSTRTQAGASYWGIMELTGNVAEHPVTIGHVTGRAFTGLHGDGTLSTPNGDADVNAWPGINATGSGSRGGSWMLPATYARVSSRDDASGGNFSRHWMFGWRAVRSAPASVGP